MKKKNLLKSMVGATALLCAGVAFGQTSGAIDMSFGINGYTFTDHINNTGEVFFDLTVLSNDKVIMVGYTDEANTDLLLTKYNADGTVDVSFGNNGKLVLDLSIGGNDGGYCVRETADHKLLVSGITMSATWDAFVMRLNEDGSTDNTFGPGGLGINKFNAGTNQIAIGVDMHVNPDSSFFVGGMVYNGNDYDFGLFKFTEGGMLDVSFGSGGSMLYDNNGVNDQLWAIHVNDNGNVYLAGTSDDGGEKGFLVKTSPFGTLDGQFNGGTGKYIYDAQFSEHYFTDVLETSTGKVVVVGSEGAGADMDGFIHQLNADGSVDNNFATNGKAISDVGVMNGVYLYNVKEYQGRLLTAGHVSGPNYMDLYAMMVNSNGTLTAEFSSGGDVYHTLPISVTALNMMGMDLQSDGKIILGGDMTSQDFTGRNTAMIRMFNINTLGMNDFNENSPLVHIFPNPVTTQFSIDTDAELIFVQLMDQSGRVVQSWEGESNVFDLNDDVSNGTYMLRMVSNRYIRQTQLQVVR